MSYLSWVQPFYKNYLVKNGDGFRHESASPDCVNEHIFYIFLNNNHVNDILSQ